VLFNLFPCLLGVFPILCGVCHWATARESLTWPTAQGTITQSKVKERIEDKEKKYYLDVVYAFRLHGFEFRGTEITSADTSYSTRMSAERDARRYHVGRDVQVYYNPDDPKETLLVPGVNWGLVFGTFVAGGLLLGAGIGMGVLFFLRRPRQAGARLRLLRRRPQPAVGLDIGTTSLKLCRVNRSGPGFQLTDLAAADLPPGVIDADRGTVQQQQLTEHLERLFQQAGISKEQVAFSVPTWSEHTSISTTELEKRSERGLSPFVIRAARAHLPPGASSSGGAYVGYRVLNHYLYSLNVLLAVSSKTVVQPYLQCVLQAGIKPVSCSPTALAARRWYEVVKSRDLETGEAIVDIGAARTVVHAATVGDETGIFCVDAGGEDITTLIRERLGVSSEEAEQLKRTAGQLDTSHPSHYRTFDKAEILKQAIGMGANSVAQKIAGQLKELQSRQNAASISRLALTGGGANLPELCEALERHCGLEVKRWTATDGLEDVGKRVDPELLRGHDLQLCVALGLAIDDGGLHLV
jgi:type IV pilus assembly protein PilM